MATTPKMTREQFIAKYALGPGGTFLADDKGGNASSEVAGQSVADYYDMFLAPDAKPRTYTDFEGNTRTLGWGDGSAYQNSAQAQDADGFDAWDNVDPHPESSRGNGLQEAWRQVGRPVATAAAMYYGAGALNSALAPTTAGLAPATGAAGAALPFELAPITVPEIGGLTATEMAAVGNGTVGTAGAVTAGATLPFELGPINVPPIEGLTAAEMTALGGGTEGIAATDAAAKAAAIASAKGMSTAEIIKTWGPTAAKLVIGALAAKAADQPSGQGTGSASIDSLVSQALGNTANMESDYNNLFKPWAIDQVGKASARGDAGYDQLMGLAGAQNKNLASYQTYVDRIGSQGYRDQQRGQAMGEVQQQSDMGLASSRRAAMARGIDPSKFALQANANSINTAAAKTKAAADAEAGAWDQWGKGAQTAADMTMRDNTSRANLITGANNLGLSGFNAGTKLATVDGAYRGGLTSGYNNTLSTMTGANNSANSQANYDKEHGLSGIVNAGLATAATKWLTDKGSDAISNIFE